MVKSDRSIKGFGGSSTMGIMIGTPYGNGWMITERNINS